MSVNLSPLGGAGAQFFSNNGVPLAGGLLYTYLAGTSTPATTYTSSNGITPLANPIILDSAGRVPTGEIWLTDGINYKFVLKDATDVLIATWDNLSGINSNFISYTAQEETVTATAGQTVFDLALDYVPGVNNLAVFVNGSKQIVGTNYTETDSDTVTFLTGLNVGDLVQFSTATPVAPNATSAANVSYTQGSAGSVATNVQTKLRETVSVKDFGAVGDGLADDTAAIQAALTAGAGKSVFVPAGVYLITSTLQISEGTEFYGVGESSRIKTVLNIVMMTNVTGDVYNFIFRDLAFDNQFPVSTVVYSTLSATTTSGSPTVAVASLANLKKSMRVSGTNIPAGAVIRYVSRLGGTDITLGNAIGTALVNATGSGATTLTLSYRQGQTNFHIYLKNSLRAQFYNVVFNTAFDDTDYSPNNHAGIWLDRDAGASYFVASIESCFFNKGQILCGISDSNIKNSIVWGNPFDYAVMLAAPGITVEGCNLSAGVNGALVTTATIAEPSGGSNHTIVGNNIDGGGIWYTGYGVQMIKPVNVTLTGNRINIAQKSGVYMTDAVNCAITGNGFLKNNEDDALFSDIESVGISFGSNRNTITGNSFFNVARTNAGYAIREVNAGFAPTSNTYSSNSVSANYLSPSFLVIDPYATENNTNVGSVTNGVTTFTPTFVNLTLGNGVATGWYKRHGNQITVYGKLTLGSTTVITGQIGLTVPLPATQNSLGSAIAVDSSPNVIWSSTSRITSTSSFVFVCSNTGVGTFWNATVPFTWASGDDIELQITYCV
jgi:hypothetical protein